MKAYLQREKCGHYTNLATNQGENPTMDVKSHLR